MGETKPTLEAYWNLYHHHISVCRQARILSIKRHQSEIVLRLTRLLRLRGPLADDPTAKLLHAILAALAVWLAVGWVVTIPLAPVNFIRVFLPGVLQASYAAALVLLRLGYFQRASLAYLFGTWMWATLHLLFPWRCTKLGSAALRVAAGFGGLAPWIQGRHQDCRLVRAQCAGICGSRHDVVSLTSPDYGNTIGQMGGTRASHPDQCHPRGTNHRRDCVRRWRNCGNTRAASNCSSNNARTNWCRRVIRRRPPTGPRARSWPR